MNARDSLLAELDRRIGICRDWEQDWPFPRRPGGPHDPTSLAALYEWMRGQVHDYEAIPGGRVFCRECVTEYDADCTHNLLIAGALGYTGEGALPPEVVLDEHGRQVLARQPNGKPFPRYTPCSADCGYVIGVGDAIDTVTHESCDARLASALGYPGEGASGEVRPCDHDTIEEAVTCEDGAAHMAAWTQAGADCGLCSHGAHEGRECHVEVPEYTHTDAPPAAPCACRGEGPWVEPPASDDPWADPRPASREAPSAHAEGGPDVPWVFYSIDRPSRANVREPFLPPRMRLVGGAGSSPLEVPLNEATLLSIIKQATDTLNRMYLSREAERDYECRLPPQAPEARSAEQAGPS